jgi:hypothetical protein
MRSFAVVVTAWGIVAALPACEGETVGEGETIGEGEGEGEGEGCFNDVFDDASADGPVVSYADGFRVGPSAACPAGELYEVYVELETEVAISLVRASFAGAAPVDVDGVRADFDGHRGDACGPAATSSITVGVQVVGAGGASQPVCGTAF